jgi:hypothetical protein
MASDPISHYHAIAKMTARVKAYDQAVKDHAVRSAPARARADRVQQRRDVHVTGRPGTEKGV